MVSAKNFLGKFTRMEGRAWHDFRFSSLGRPPHLRVDGRHNEASSPLSSPPFDEREEDKSGRKVQIFHNKGTQLQFGTRWKCPSLLPIFTIVYRFTKFRQRCDTHDQRSSDSAGRILERRCLLSLDPLLHRMEEREKIVVP
jgi:hypothetical protein